MIDFHCHLDLYPNPRKVIEECRRRNIYTLSVTTTPSAWEGNLKIVSDSPRIRLALGLHPELAHERQSELTLFDKLLPSTRYVGEIGLDGGPKFTEYWADQVKVFDHILNSCSNAGGRIMSIHSRRAVKQVLESLSKFPSAGKAVMHWFTGSAKELDAAISAGCWFSVGYGLLKSGGGQDLVKRMPPDRVLTESDGPFVTIGSEPMLPWEMGQVIEQLSAIWRLSLTETQKRLYMNLRNLVDAN